MFPHSVSLSIVYLSIVYRLLKGPIDHCDSANNIGTYQAYQGTTPHEVLETKQSIEQLLIIVLKCQSYVLAIDYSNPVCSELPQFL